MGRHLGRNGMGRALGCFNWQRPLVALALMLVGVACQETVSFNVIRPARVNVRGMAGEGADATVALGQWQGVDSGAVEDIKQRLREMVTNAPGGYVKLTEAEGIVRLDGNVSEYAYDENVESKSEQCTKTENKKTVTYACTRYTRKATARIRASMNVVDHTGKTIAADTFSDAMNDSTSSTDEQPAPIDREQMLSSLRYAAAAELAKLVVPYPVVVEKRWFKCGDANDTCKAALTQLRGGNFEGAKGLLQQAIDALRAAPEPDAKALAAAWWGLTLAHEFSGDYPAARAALQEAIQANPKEDVFAREMQSIQQEEASTQQLSRQIGE